MEFQKSINFRYIFTPRFIIKFEDISYVTAFHLKKKKSLNEHVIRYIKFHGTLNLLQQTSTVLRYTIKFKTIYGNIPQSKHSKKLQLEALCMTTNLIYYVTTLPCSHAVRSADEKKAPPLPPLLYYSRQLSCTSHLSAIRFSSRA